MISRKEHRRSWLRVSVNLGLLGFGAAMVFSGLLLQLAFHLGHHQGRDVHRLVLGMTYSQWLRTHQYAILLVSAGIVWHVILHWKWYKTVLPRRRLVVLNHQTVALTGLFLLAALTGYVGWVIKIGGGAEPIRRTWIEIHDKITLVLLVYLAVHVTKRRRWFLSFWKREK